MANKICRECKMIYESGNECPNCSSKESSENFKGHVIVFDAEQSEIAKNIGVTKKGNYAIKI